MLYQPICVTPTADGRPALGSRPMRSEPRPVSSVPALSDLFRGPVLPNREDVMANTRKDDVISWLRDAHAMEAATIRNLEGLIGRSDGYPQLKGQLQNLRRRSWF
jgi:hypothetical protein